MRKTEVAERKVGVVEKKAEAVENKSRCDHLEYNLYYMVSRRDFAQTAAAADCSSCHAYVVPVHDLR
jgi:hypothetical protein